MTALAYDPAVLQIAVDEANAGRAEGGLAIGSALTYRGELFSRGRNLRHQQNSPILHAEMTCLCNAERRSPEFYHECVLYTTLSPCPMCTGTIILYGIPKVVIGTPTLREWGEERLREMGVEVIHANSEACADLLKKMLKEVPDLLHEDGGNFFAKASL